MLFYLHFKYIWNELEVEIKFWVMVPAGFFENFFGNRGKPNP